MTSPSTWWNIGEWVASWSQRKVRPGTMMRIGGFCASIVRICTGEVWVRSTSREPSARSRQVEGVVLLAGRDARAGC